MSAERITSARPTRTWWWLAGGLAVIVAIVVIVVAVGGGSGSPATTSTPGHPAAVLTPSPDGVVYHDGQTITLAVPANKIFTPYSRIIVLECSDPGGQADKLPVDESVCDGNTVNAYSILIAKDGSFSTGKYHSYQLFVLPNRALGESPDGQPVCDKTHYCVLYIGQDQNNFRAPKIFSAPFTVSGSGTSPTTP